MKKIFPCKLDRSVYSTQLSFPYPAGEPSFPAAAVVFSSTWNQSWKSFPSFPSLHIPFLYHLGMSSMILKIVCAVVWWSWSVLIIYF